MRFVSIGGRYFNMDRVTDFCLTQNGNLRISFDADAVENINVSRYNIDSIRADLEGARHIVQVIPNTADLWMVWSDGDDSHVAGRVHFLALCANGQVEALSLGDGFFEVEDSSNFKGIFSEKDLASFPGLTRIDIQEGENCE